MVYRIFVYVADDTAKRGKRRIIRKDLEADNPAEVFAWLYHVTNRSSADIKQTISEVKITARPSVRQTGITFKVA